MRRPVISRPRSAASEVVPRSEAPAPPTTPSWVEPRALAVLGLAEAMDRDAGDAPRRDGALAPDDVQQVHEQAYAAGLRKARATVETIMSRYHAAIAELELVRDRVFLETEDDLVSLALEIAKQVIGADLSAQRAYAERMVDHALKLLRGADKITLRLSSSDYAALVRKRPELVSSNSVVQVVEDASITLGGLVAECELGRVDATVERRLVEAGAQLRAALAGERQDERRAAQPLTELADPAPEAA